MLSSFLQRDAKNQPSSLAGYVGVMARGAKLSNEQKVKGKMYETKFA